MFDLLTPKHKKRVNDVYPTHPGEEGASSAKLSRLTYYINSKPLKVKKVFAYLESKVKNDIGKQRTGYNKVSLEIIDTLIESCSDHIRLFATNSLRIIYILVVNGDEELATRATASFNRIMTCSDSAALALDPEFRNVLQSLIEKYTNMCKFESSDLGLERDYRLVGMSALRSVFIWEDFATLNPSYKIDDITVALLNNLKDSQSLHALVPSRSRERSPTSYSSGKRNSFYDEVVTDEGLDKLAVSCLELLIKKASTSYMTTILSSVFKFLDDHSWAPHGLALNVIKIVIYSAQNQTLFLVVSHVFRILDSPNFAQEYGVKGTMIDILKLVLGSNRSPLGISSTELLGYLLRHLKKSIQRELNSNIGAENQHQEQVLQGSIISTIESILGHKDYASQKFEAIVYVVMRVSSTILNTFNTGASVTTSEDGSSSPLHAATSEESMLKYRSMCMKIISVLSKKPTLDKDTFISFPFKLVEKLLRLAMDPENDVRLHALLALRDLCIHDLSLLLEEDVPIVNALKKVSGDQDMILAISKKFRFCLLKSSLLLNNEPRHFLAIFQLLVAAGNVSSLKELSKNMSMMMYLQKLAQEETFRKGLHRFLQMLVISYLIFAARKLDAKLLLHYLQQLLQERKNDSQWYPLIDFYSEEDISQFTISGLESSGSWKQVDIFVSAVEMKKLMQDCNVLSDHIDMIEKPYEPETENLDADLIFTRTFGPKYEMTRKNSSDGALPLGHADSNSSIGAKEMKEALTKGKKSEATRVLLSKINYETEPRRKSMVEFQTTSQSQLNLRIDKESEIRALLEGGDAGSSSVNEAGQVGDADDESKINEEIDKILQESEIGVPAEGSELGEGGAVEGDKKNLGASSPTNNLKVSRSRELFSDSCVLNLPVPDPLQ